MTSPASTRLPGLDALRALAITSVMAYHLSWRVSDSLHPYTRFGWIGVDLFFVLSGYLIASQLFRPLLAGGSVKLADFYRRRAYRILPAYLVVLALYAWWPAFREETGMSPLWEFLTFTENFFVDYAKNQAFSHVWSLCVEEHFYLLFPLIVLWLSRRASAWKTVAVLGSLVILGITIRTYVLLHVLRPLGTSSDSFSVRYIQDVYYPTYTRLDGLLTGVALALGRSFRPAWWERLAPRANVLMLCGIALIVASGWMFTGRFTFVYGAAAAGTIVGFPALSIGLGLLVLAGAESSSWLGRWRIPGAKTVAMLSFSLYLSHKAVAHLAHVHLPRLADTHDWRAAMFYAVSCLLGATLLYGCVERPFLMLRARREQKPMNVDFEVRADPAL